MTARMTRVTATQPSIVTKTFALTNGALHKGTTADIYAGHVDLVEVPDLSAFGEVLKGLTPAQCMVYGIAIAPSLELVTEKAWAQAGRPAHQVARTKEAFRWHDGPGILMLDYDPAPDSKPLTRAKLVKMVRSACPALATIQMLWWPSASSNIVNTETGEELRGIRGQRLYIMVSDASDIPRAGKTLCDHLWVAGVGRFDVSKSGSLLERSLFDTSVWQTNRIDFAGGAKCRKPLAQQRGDPVLISGKSVSVDTITAIPDLDGPLSQVASQQKSDSRQLKQTEAEAARTVWVSLRTDELVLRIIKKSGATEQQARAQAKAHVERVLTRSELFADWELTVKSPEPRGGGAAVTVSVAEVLDNPYKWHGCQTLDPIEPGYDGGRWIGKLFLIGARPSLHSFAHGGQRYRLLRQLHRIEIVRGKLSETVDSLIEVFRRSPDMYDYGSEVATPAGAGKLLRMEKDNLRYTAATVTQFWKWLKTPQGGLVEVLENPPVDVIASVLALKGKRSLKPLDAVISAPLMRLDGTILSLPGYDAETRLLLDMTDPPQEVPEHPTPEQLKAAFTRLWAPFEKFPYVSPVDRGVQLTGLLTAIVRPILTTAPAIAFDATRQGTGKTLQAECCAVLATGERPITWPHVAHNEEETRKRLLTVLRGGHRVLLWDNVVGRFDSPSLAVLLTSEFYTDRVLGISGSETYPNRLLTLFTGNNFTPCGELPRRVLQCRLDAQTESPYTRQFGFNPTDVCMANRQAMVTAGLTLLRGYVAAGRPKSAPALGSFGQWDAMVRQAVLWIADHVAPPGLLGDPVQSILDNADGDPADAAQFDLMQAWSKIFCDKTIIARDLLNVYEKVKERGSVPSNYEQQLADALDEFKTDREMSAKSIGILLANRRDRTVGGLRIVRSVATVGGKWKWRVLAVVDTNPEKKWFEGFEGSGSSPKTFTQEPVFHTDEGNQPTQTTQTTSGAGDLLEVEL
jgi:hypothetical protein